MTSATTTEEREPVDFALIPLGVEVAVPRTLRQITPYVLKEQGDWFEDEIKFIRKIIEPGSRALDIGANHGVYALTLARLVGPSGKVWAIEPDPLPMGRLRRSVARNKFGNVTLIEAGLSNHVGRAPLYTSGHSELNSLTGASGSASHEIELKTLDGCVREHEIEKIDFVKLDAEGEEARILEAAGEFLKNEDPVIMFELKHGDQLNLPLIKQFQSLGYDSYRLVPGLDVLIPFSADSKPDGFLLNLFVCKKSRAASLEKEGILATVLEKPKGDSGADWKSHLAPFPYAQLLSDKWKSAPKEPGWENYEKALELYVRAHAPGVAPGARFMLLNESLQLLAGLFPIHANFSRGQTLARVAWELGLRQSAIQVLTMLVGLFESNQQLKLDEPFLPVSPRYEMVDPKQSLGQWCLSAILEQRETLRTFSSFFETEPAIPTLEAIATLGFQSEAMKRRLEVMKSKASGQSG